MELNDGWKSQREHVATPGQESRLSNFSWCPQAACQRELGPADFAACNFLSAQAHEASNQQFPLAVSMKINRETSPLPLWLCDYKTFFRSMT